MSQALEDEARELQEEAQDILNLSRRSYSCSSGGKSPVSKKQGNWKGRKKDFHPPPGRALATKDAQAKSPTSSSSSPSKTVEEADDRSPATWGAAVQAAVEEDCAKKEINSMKQQLGLLLLGADMLKRRLAGNEGDRADRSSRSQSPQGLLRPTSPAGHEANGPVLGGSDVSAPPWGVGFSGYEASVADASLYTPASTQRSFVAHGTPQLEFTSRPLLALSSDRSAKYVGCSQDDFHSNALLDSAEGAFFTTKLPSSPVQRAHSPAHAAHHACASPLRAGAQFVTIPPAVPGARTPCASPAKPVAVYVAGAVKVHTPVRQIAAHPPRAAESTRSEL